MTETPYDATAPGDAGDANFDDNDLDRPMTGATGETEDGEPPGPVRTDVEGGVE